MIYIVREHDKDGGASYDNPDDAIAAAIAWELATGIECEIYMRWEYPQMQRVVELLSVPHTSEVRSIVERIEYAQ